MSEILLARLRRAKSAGFLATIVALVLAGSPALADFTIQGPVTYNSTYFAHTGANVRCIGTACGFDVGTLGHTLGFLDGNKTDSGTNDFTGGNTFTGVYGRGREITSSDILTSADCGRTVVSTGGSTVTVTTFSSGAPAGKLCAIAVIQQGAGQVNFAAGGGTTLASPINCTKAFGQGAIASLVVWGGSPDAWYLGGSCLP